MSTIKKNKLFLFIIGLLLLSNITLAVFYTRIDKKDAGSWRERNDSRITQVLKEEVGFSEQQMQQFEAMKQQHRDVMRPLFDSMRYAKEKLYNQLYQPEVQDSVITSASELIGEKQQLVDKQLFHHFRELRALCTPEQQPRFDTLMHNMVQRMIVPGRRGGHKDKVEAEEKKHHSSK